jgi:hypothetical protein
MTSARVALALDPVTLGGTAHHVGPPGGERWRLDVRATVDVRYRAGASLVLGRVRGVPIVVDEGLFAALQDRGWLHPYRAVWVWSAWADDPFLRDRSTVERDWRENLLHELGDL